MLHAVHPHPVEKLAILADFFFDLRLPNKRGLAFVADGLLGVA